MNFIGDYFALGLITILFVFFFDSKTSIRYMPSSSILFVCCLVTTALTAATDLMTGHLMEMEYVPLWQNLLWNTLYFVINIITTTFIAMSGPDACSILTSREIITAVRLMRWAMLLRCCRWYWFVFVICETSAVPADRCAGY